MKLTTKLTAICAALVLTVAAALSGLMLWQVREQSYNSLEEHTQEKLNDLARDLSRIILQFITLTVSGLNLNVGSQHFPLQQKSSLEGFPTMIFALYSMFYLMC